MASSLQWHPLLSPSKSRCMPKLRRAIPTRQVVKIQAFQRSDFDGFAKRVASGEAWKEAWRNANDGFEQLLFDSKKAAERFDRRYSVSSRFNSVLQSATDKAREFDREFEIQRKWRTFTLDFSRNLPTYRRQLNGFLDAPLGRTLSCHRPLHVSCVKNQLTFPVVDHQKSESSDSELLRYLLENKLEEARLLLERMLQKGRCPGVVCWTSMLSKFAKEGFIDEAEALFEIMPERNLVTYNAMLSAYVHSGRVADACQFFEAMPERNVVSWTSMLCGLTHCGRIAAARKLFDVMPDKNVVTWNSMITGLTKNGDLVEARKLFDMMPARNQVSWNVMIAGYAENGKMEEARVLFNIMPDHNIVTWTTLVAGYCRAGDLDEGYYIFQRMPERNVVSWTAMIGGFAWNGFYEEALLLFLEMRMSPEMKPNEETFISLVYACSGVGFPLLGKQVHAHLTVNGWDCHNYDGRLSKSLIHMYSGFGMMDFADYIFSNNSSNWTIQSYNSVINGFIRIGELQRAQFLFDTMPNRDEISWTSMITGYFNAGNVSEACRLFNSMPRRDAVSWTVMISGHIQNELFAEAIFMFSEMRLNGVTPLDSSYSSLLGAAGAMAYLDQGKQLHGILMKTRYKLDTILENSLIAMYAKCGEIDIAHQIFSHMISRDIVTWNTMIMGFSHHGLVNKALKLFEAFRDSGICPNSVTFLGLLSACSHAGMVDQGWEVFYSMSKEYSIQPGVEHYVSMIDLLGRAGKVEEAEKLVLSLPFEPGLEVWGALLGICGLGEMSPAVARRSAEQVLKLEPLNAPAHILLCNIYAATGLQNEEGMLRKSMETKGIRKVPGCSWIMLMGEVHIFLSGDKSHLKSEEYILSWLAIDEV